MNFEADLAGVGTTFEIDVLCVGNSSDPDKDNCRKWWPYTFNTLYSNGIANLLQRIILCNDLSTVSVQTFNLI